MSLAAAARSSALLQEIFTTPICEGFDPIPTYGADSIGSFPDKLRRRTPIELDACPCPVFPKSSHPLMDRSSPLVRLYFPSLLFTSPHHCFINHHIKPSRLCRYYLHRSARSSSQRTTPNSGPRDEICHLHHCPVESRIGVSSSCQNRSGYHTGHD